PRVHVGALEHEEDREPGADEQRGAPRAQNQGDEACNHQELENAVAPKLLAQLQQIVVQLDPGVVAEIAVGEAVRAERDGMGLLSRPPRQVSLSADFPERQRSEARYEAERERNERA